MDGSGPGGGSLSLIELLDRYGEELYADFHRFYRLDLVDLCRGRLSPRLVLALIRQLPIDSAFVTASRGGAEYVGWDRHSYLLADLYDAINLNTLILMRANSDKPKKVKPFPPYPRPGVEPEKDKKRSVPNPLLTRLRGEEPKPPEKPRPSRVPLPPPRP